jgi:hypothetical protein
VKGKSAGESVLPEMPLPIAIPFCPPDAIFLLLPPSHSSTSCSLNVLTAYSEDMKRLLKRGYSARERPSGNKITHELTEQGSAIPPNLLTSGSNDANGIRTLAFRLSPPLAKPGPPHSSFFLSPGGDVEPESASSVAKASNSRAPHRQIALL